MSDELDKPRAPGWLAKRWGCSVDALRKNRERGHAPTYHRMPSGHVRYRLRDVLEVEMAGRHSFRDLPAVMRTLAAVDGLSNELLAAIETKLREAYAAHE